MKLPPWTIATSLLLILMLSGCAGMTLSVSSGWGSTNTISGTLTIDPPAAAPAAPVPVVIPTK